jgi:DNA-binding NarL/FixJ family response regulator
MDNYVARKPCGCIVGAISKTMSADEIAKALASWAGRGLSVDSASDEQVREQWHSGKCPHDEVQLSLFETMKS